MFIFLSFLCGTWFIVDVYFPMWFYLLLLLLFTVDGSRYQERPSGQGSRPGWDLSRLQYPRPVRGHRSGQLCEYCEVEVGMVVKWEWGWW